jgi:hypothetical protein
MVELNEGLEVLQLQEHLHPAMCEDDISIDPRTDFGRQVLEELGTRAQLPPCPEGQCEPGTDGSCRWCGKTKG